MLRVVEAFSGIGSQAKALKKANLEHEILHTVEWDISAIIAYDLIHNGIQDIARYRAMDKQEIDRIITRHTLSLDGKNPLSKIQARRIPHEIKIRLAHAIVRTGNLGSIVELRAEDLPTEFDLMTYSFPCQDLSIASVWHGNTSGIDRHANNRSGMLWEVERVLEERAEKGLKLPRFLLMENVTNILSPRHRYNFECWKVKLEDLGYTNQLYKLKASDFGIPQRRERIFMISVFHGGEAVAQGKIESYFFRNNLNHDDMIGSLEIDQRKLKDFLRTDYSCGKYRVEAEESRPNDTPSRTKIFEENDVLVDEKGIVASYINTITTKQDRNPNSGVIVCPKPIPGKAVYRNLTPRECFLLMGFGEEDFDALMENEFWPTAKGRFFTNSKLIKMAGNSIVVDVLEQIFIQIDEINRILHLNSDAYKVG